MADRTVRVRLEAAVAGYRAQMQQAAADTRNASTSIQGHVRENAAAYQTAGIAAAAMGVAAAAGIRSVLSAGSEFQAGMNRVRAVSGATGDQFDQLNAQARELGAATKFSATEAADGMGFLAMAGFETTQIMSAMPGVLELAAAGAMDLGTAADIASNVLTGFGLAADQVGRINDALAATFTTTNTSLQQLGEAMKFVAPVAASAGVSLEEVAAAIGLMGNAGIQGSMAGTSLRGAITRLLNPSGQAASILDRLGVSVMAADGSMRGLDEIVQQLEQSSVTTGEMMEIFGQRAGPAMVSLVTQGADALRDQTKVALESAGTAAEIAEIQMEGLAGSIIELRSASEGLKIALFESGAGDVFESMVDSVTGLVRTLESAPPAVHATVMGFGTLTAVAGTFGGATLLLLPRIVATRDAMMKLAGTTSILRGSMIGLTRFALHPATLAIGAGVTVLGLWAKAKGDARRRVEELTEAIKADSGALEENTRQKTVNQLEDDGLLRTARDLGISLENVTDAALGNAGAWQEVYEGARDAEEALIANSAAGAANAGVIADGRNEIHGFIEALRRQNGATDDAAVAYDRQKEAMGETVGTAADLTGAYEELEEQTEDTLTAFQTYTDALRAQFDPAFAAIRATQRLDEAMNDEETSAIDLLAAILDVAAANADLAASEQQSWTPAMEAMAREAGATEQQIEEMRAAVIDARVSAEEFEGNYVATMEVDTRTSMGKFRDLERRAGWWSASLPESVVLADTDEAEGSFDWMFGLGDDWSESTFVALADADITAAKAKASEIGRELDRAARDRTSTITVRQRTTGGAIEGRASGGRVNKDQMYVVGEAGWEYFKPDVSGTIIPHHQSQTMSSSSTGGGGPTRGHEITVIAPSTDAREIVAEQQRALNRSLILAGVG